MPPCPPPESAQTNGPTIVEDAATLSTTVESKSNLTSNTKAPFFDSTKKFAYELNILSATVLVAVYAALPAAYLSYLYGFLVLVTVDAVRYYHFRGSTPGVPYSLPMVSLMAMLVYPVRFWHEQAQIAMHPRNPDYAGMSTNTLVGKNMIFLTDAKLCRDVMVREGIFQIYAHPNAKWLFGPGNLIYMPTQMHKNFRAMLTPALFSNEALTLYASAQERIVREYLAKIARKCQESGAALDVRVAFRSMAAAASQESFMGPYLTDQLRVQLEDDILEFTLGFLCFPFPYLNTGLAKAVAAKQRLLKTIIKFVPLSRDHVTPDSHGRSKEPRCLLEYWQVAIGAAAKEKGVSPMEIPGCSDLDVAMTIMDFLFAAQDATNSALTFTSDVLATRPDVVAKIRTEVTNSVTPEKPIWSMVRDADDLTYTCRAANHMLHHKPPVPMIPHLALQNTTLGGRTIPKGTILIPSMLNAGKTSGSSSNFNPDELNPDPQFVKTPIFGGGQHKCPGRRYAESLLAVFMAVLLTEYDFERVGKRPDVDDIIYYPTLFPSENLFIIQPRASTDAI